ncbi:glycoside hydrolase family 28 protein [Pelagicoccus sp. NFK12]|uniref:Glycoside hydrolase family 28 protein n=1 Tax=Pelagicoccus enzymogenes TaxID=2773457 RepID=A0A927IIW8_9BACT|nr:glycoside hydrolase family 28 protein [Pelagicoccus enzymogenes]MBD5780930.1 glycoside hydrolase family 28 protein [Pelagicoccus enzymogenes]
MKATLRITTFASVLFAGFLSEAFATPQFTSDGRLWGGDEIQPVNAPFGMPQLARPSFKADVFNILDFAAVEGGKVKNTEAFANAIAACADNGGGRVLVPAGKWFTGPIHLKSNVELHLAEGSEVIFSDTLEDYLPVVRVRAGSIEIYNYSPLIYARDCENIGITGPGRLNGNAEKWWDWKHKETRDYFTAEKRGIPVEERIYGKPEDAIRPSFVQLFNCRNILLEGFTIGSGPNWTIHPVFCENIIIRRVHVLTDGPNNDGIDPDSSRNLLVEHCVFDTGDDCMVLKSGYNEDGWRAAAPTENVVMRWCTSKRGHGGLVIGSEMSGDVRNVYMYECEFEGTDRALRIKSRRGRGGIVENVWAENLVVKDMQREVVILNMDYGADKNALTNQRAPLFRNIHVSDVYGEGAPMAIRIVGLPDSLIENVTFENIRVKSTEGVYCQNATGLSFKNIDVSPEEGPVFTFDNVNDVDITAASSASGASTFVKVLGKNSHGIVIKKSNLSTLKSVTELGDEVAAEAVTIK